MKKIKIVVIQKRSLYLLVNQINWQQLEGWDYLNSDKRKKMTFIVKFLGSFKGFDRDNDGKTKPEFQEKCEFQCGDEWNFSAHLESSAHQKSLFKVNGNNENFFE